MFKIALVDDNPLILKEYLRIFQKIENTNHFKLQIQTFLSGEAFMEYVNKHLKNLFDLLLLDITMEKMSGLEVVKQIHDLHIKMPIVFLTANESYMFQKEDENVIQTIIKTEVEKETFEKMFITYYRQYNKVRKQVDVEDYKKEKKQLEIKDIIYIHNQKDVVSSSGMYLINEDYDVFHTLPFFNTKQYIINLAHVKRIKEDSILMDNEETLQLHKEECEHLKIAFAKYLSESLL